MREYAHTEYAGFKSGKNFKGVRPMESSSAREKKRASREAGKTRRSNISRSATFSMSSAPLRVGKFVENISERNEGTILLLV